MCAIDGGESYQVFHSEVRRAAKPHKCGECGRTIGKGETYEYATGMYDGYWSYHKSCAHCRVAQEWLSNNCGGFIYEGVWEDFHEHASEYPPLAPFINSMSELMLDQWHDGKDPIPSLPPSIKWAVEQVAS